MAARKPSRSRKSASRPAWVLLVAGVVIGLGVAGLGWLASVKLPAAKAPVTQDKPAAGKPAKPAATQPDSPDYTFYTVLPRDEMRAAEQEPANARPQANERFVLQVGSFKQSSEADRKRAELLLLGLDVFVEKVTLNNGETWNRVLVGPFDSRSKADAARNTLSANQVDAMLLKRQAQ